jgi:hypothetical protein
MSDARRYRMNAAECLLAAKTCEPPYRGFILAVATSWHALARHDEAMDELVATWTKADAAAFAAAIPRRVLYGSLKPLPKWRSLTVRGTTPGAGFRHPLGRAAGAAG